MPIIAISHPRLAIIAHMRWAMKPGESLIRVTLVPDLANIAAAASRTAASAPGGVMIVMRLAVSPVTSTATTRLGSSSRSIASVVASLPTGATRIGLLPSSTASVSAPEATTSCTSFSLWLSITTALVAGGTDGR